MSVYAWSYKRIIGIMIITLLLWRILFRYIGGSRWWKLLNIVGACIGIIIILKFTVWGRTPSDVHQVMFAAEYSSEFYREMLMNIFLYFPLGLTLNCVIGPSAIWTGFLLSFSIETWQFFAGTGVAQGTDVICNTLGMVIGFLAIWRASRRK